MLEYRHVNHGGRPYFVGNTFFLQLANFMHFVLDFKEIINKKMGSHDVNHDEDQTGEYHSSTWKGRFNKMKADSEAQNVKFSEFSRRTEQQLLVLYTALQTTIVQTSEKGKRNCKYSGVDLPSEERPELQLSACSRKRVGTEHRLNAHQHKVLQETELQLSAQQSGHKFMNYFLIVFPAQDRMVLVRKI